MKIEFSPATVTLDEGNAIVALLVMKFGDAAFNHLRSSTALTHEGQSLSANLKAFDVEDAPSADDTEDAPARATASDVELDAEGMPWDARIHASTKTKLKDSQAWKPLRGVDANLVKQVEAAYRAQGYGNVEVSGTTPPPAASTTAPPPPAATTAAPPPPAEATKAPPPPSEALLQAAAASAVTVTPFAACMKRITELQKEGKLDDETKAAFVAEAGLENLAKGVGQPEKMQALLDNLNAAFGA